MYKPNAHLYAGIRNALPLQLFPWDDYFPRMAETDFLAGRQDVIAVKSFFIRKAPFGGSYAVLGGITDALRTICELDFTAPEFQMGMLDMDYKPEFVLYLKCCNRLNVKVFAGHEGSIFFPNEPIITIVGPLPHIRLVEGIITEACNFATLSLTKWTRLVRAVRPGGVLEFARRRAQNSLKVSLYAALAGCTSSSNSEIRRFFEILITGTMGHEWMQSFASIAEAFDVWLTYNPRKAIGLVDTMQCLEVDFPTWLDAVYKHRELIRNVDPKIWGWRNDSGDLAYLTIEQYSRFFKHPLAQDPWFADKMRIILTNDLDEYSASEILSQIRDMAGPAGFDVSDITRRIIWAAGTKPGTCNDQPSLGGVAKLMEVENHACIKLAFDAHGMPGEKTSLPGFNHSALIFDESGVLVCTLIYPADGYMIVDGLLCSKDGMFSRVIKPLICCHTDNLNARMEIENYTAISQQVLCHNSLTPPGPGFLHPTMVEVTARIHSSIDRLHFTQQRLVKPYPVKVSVTPDLFDLRQAMIKQRVLRQDGLCSE